MGIVSKRLRPRLTMNANPGTCEVSLGKMLD
jgi:hypothetical protein